MDGPARRFLRVAAQGLALSIGVRPDKPLALVGFGAFVLAWGLATASFALHDFLLTPCSQETFDLFDEGRAALALGYAVGSVAVGVAAVFLGSRLGRLM